MNPLYIALPAALLLAGPFSAIAAEYQVQKVGVDLSRIPDVQAGHWNEVPELEVGLLAQMMVNPKPEKANTPKVKVQMLHDGKFVAYRLRWNDPEPSEAGRLAEYSDAVAVQFPVLDNAVPPPIFMGAAKNPVHIFHWRAQYQRDELLGMKTIKDVYPNMSTDIYPNEFPDRGRLKPATEAQTEMFVTGKAAGNPQSYPKKAVDEMRAEGFGTSVVVPADRSVGRGEWKDGAWTVVIARPLASSNGSVLEQGKGAAIGLAVWQGGEKEVGSRKSMTMVWTPFRLGEK
jgi:DMSO reductase family type II enzyme heme b subunit